MIYRYLLNVVLSAESPVIVNIGFAYYKHALVVSGVFSGH